MLNDLLNSVYRLMRKVQLMRRKHSQVVTLELVLTVEQPATINRIHVIYWYTCVTCGFGKFVLTTS